MATVDPARLPKYTRLSLVPTARRGVQYDLSPTTVAVEYLSLFAPDLDIAWRVDEAARGTVASGTFAGPATGADLGIRFTPPRYGSYAVSAVVTHGERIVCSACVLVGVVDGGGVLPETFGDPAGQGEIDLIAWAGARVARLNTSAGAEQLAARIAYAKRKGLDFIVQFVNDADFTPANAAAFATRFRGVKWECRNEPDAVGAEYVARLAAFARALKGADPTAVLLGPTMVTVAGSRLAEFNAARGWRHIDQPSTHDYLGNEQVDAAAWRHAFGPAGTFATAVAAGGKGDAPRWVTERDVAGIYGGALVWTAQAVYLLWHYDLLDAMGIPAGRNVYYYFADMGYYSVPSWLYGQQGPMPGLLALRVRQTVIGNKPLTGTLDFGPTLNRCLLGLMHGQVVTLVNLGQSAPIAVTLNVATPERLKWVDAFGNSTTVTATGGQLTLSVTTLPQYLVLPAGVSVTAATPAWPTVNLAAGWSLSTTAAAAPGWGPASLVTAAGPLPSALGDGGGMRAVWAADGASLPRTVTFTGPAPATATRCIVWSEFADNLYCCLLAFDLQAWVGDAWVTVASHDVDVPAAWHGKTPYASVDLPNEMVQSYLGDNFALLTFPATTSDQWRLNVRATSWGLATDSGLHRFAATVHRSAPALINLRRFELFA